jgi:hypothetical protein
MERQVRGDLLDNVNSENNAYLLGSILGLAEIGPDDQLRWKGSKADAGCIDDLRRLVMEAPGRLHVQKQSNRYFVARSAALIERTCALMRCNLRSLTARDGLRLPAPRDLPTSLIKHFARGLFDGCGRAYWDAGEMALSVDARYDGLWGELLRAGSLPEAPLVGYAAMDAMIWMYEGCTIAFKSNFDKYRDFCTANAPYTRDVPGARVSVRKVLFPTLAAAPTKGNGSDDAWTLRVVSVSTGDGPCWLETGLEAKPPLGWTGLLLPHPLSPKWGSYSAAHSAPRGPQMTFSGLGHSWPEVRACLSRMRSWTSCPCRW